MLDDSDIEDMFSIPYDTIGNRCATFGFAYLLPV